MKHAADLASTTIDQCVVCGLPDTNTEEGYTRNHTDDCLIGVIESYLKERGAIE